jgi:amino acid adenylation domain-containing protein/non-ribosomal peptide synthase protein (TIGR01720 family)
MVEDFPLTKQQLGLWIEQKLHPKNTSYNTCVKIQLNGDLDVERFLNASRLVIDYFETLKVYFVEKNGVPFQRIDPSLQYLPEYVDISQKLEDNKTKINQAKKLLSEKLHTPIDLGLFPIMRASLIKAFEGCYFFIGMVPHIVSDGKAAVLYLEALSIAYNQGRKGLEEVYGNSKTSWRDFVKDDLFQLEQAQWLQGKRHWQRRLENATHYFDYSYGKSLQNADDKRGARIYFDLSNEVSSQLKLHCKRNRTTLFNVLACVFSIFVYKYFGLKDVLIGYPINIRPPGYKHFFGFFVNILPLRINMSSNPSYQELLADVHKIRKEDKSHQKYPALDLVSDIRERVEDFDGRVFNLSMAQTVSRLFDLQLDDIDTQPLDTEYYDVNDDFSLSYELIDQRIGLWFEYRQSLFDKPFIEQAMVHIERIIFQVMESPDKKVGQFELLSPLEIDKSLRLLSCSYEFPQENQNNTKSKSSAGSPNNYEDDYDCEEDCEDYYINSNKFDSHISVFSLFDEQAKTNPDSIAIVEGEKEYSYSKLSEVSDIVHSNLKLHSAGIAIPIVVSMKRSFEQIAVILGVLKSGNFYVPVPVDLPKQRKLDIAEDVGAALWIGDSALFSNSTSDFETMDFNKLLQENVEGITYLNEKQVMEGSGIYEKMLPAQQLGNKLAYVIYTSGSTGKPKGVAVEHASIVDRLVWLCNYFKLDNSTAVLHNTDYSFDVSVAEIFWPLSSGARLILSDQTQLGNTDYLLSLLNRNNVSVACMVPSLLQALLQTEGSERLLTLRHLLCAGEPLSSSLRNQWVDEKLLDDCQLYNFYGPTETSIYASFHKLEKHKERPVVIGKALANTRFLVLDDNHQMCPAGVVGQLFIGGEGLARGYYGDSEKSRRSFVINPLGIRGLESQVFYASGDLVRYDEQGCIDYIGREDKQIKIRGFRVELGEIEETIALHSLASQCAVVSRKNNRGNSQLIAFVCLRSAAMKQLISVNLAADADSPEQYQQAPNNEDMKTRRRVAEEVAFDEIKNFLSRRLPSYMVPSHFQSLDAIPRLSSGKVNRAKLSSLSISLKQSNSYIAPSTSNELQLVEIWSDLLDVDSANIGINTSFFDLGGDSLMAIQFVSLASQKGIYFSIGDLFESRTIAELAPIAKSSANDEQTISYTAELPFNDDSNPKEAFPLLPRQQKFFDDSFEEPNHWNRTFFFSVDDSFDLAAFKRAFITVLQHHPGLRVKFEMQADGTRLQKIEPACHAKFELDDLVASFDISNLSKEKLGDWVAENINVLHRKIDLDEAPLIRLGYFYNRGHGGNLAIIFHHLLIDMVSSRIVFEDLISAYEYAKNNLPIILQRQTAALHRWAKYASKMVSNPRVQQAIEYWGAFPNDPKPVLPLSNLLGMTNTRDKIESKSNRAAYLKNIEQYNVEKYSLTKVFQLSEISTRQLMIDSKTMLGMPIQDFLLAVLFETISVWGDGEQMTVSTCGHGRNIRSKDFDLSRTVGWLNTVYSVLIKNFLEVPIAQLSNRELLQMVKKQLENVPEENGDYNRLRYSQKEASLTKHSSPEIFFNYVGQIDPIIPKNSPIKPTFDLPGIAGVDPRNHLAYLLYYEAGVLDGKLLVRLTYSSKLFSETSIAKMIERFIDATDRRLQILTNESELKEFQDANQQT